MIEDQDSYHILLKSNILNQELGNQILAAINNESVLLEEMFDLEVRFDVRSYKHLPKSNRKEAIYALLDDQLKQIENSLMNSRITINGTKMIGADLENKDIVEIILKKADPKSKIFVNSIIPNERSLQEKIEKMFMDKYLKEQEIEALLDEL